MEIKDVIALIGGWSVVIIGISAWIGARIADSIRLKLESTYQNKIEILKSELYSEQEMFRTSLVALNSGHQASQVKRIKAIEIMWNAMRVLRDYTGKLETFYGILLLNEYAEAVKKDLFLVKSYSMESTAALLSKANDTVELQRPFLGEYLYNLFFLYRAFLLRIVVIFSKQRDEGNFTEWFKDEHVIAMYESAVPVNERPIKSYSQMGTLAICIGSFEQKILFEANKILSGQVALEVNYSEARKLIDIVEQTKRRK